MRRGGGEEFLVLPREGRQSPCLGAAPQGYRRPGAKPLKGRITLGYRPAPPLLSRGGESRRGSGGWGGAGQENHWLANTTPSARAKVVALRLFLCRAATLLG